MTWKQLLHSDQKGIWHRVFPMYLGLPVVHRVGRHCVTEVFTNTVNGVLSLAVRWLYRSYHKDRWTYAAFFCGRGGLGLVCGTALHS